MQKLLDYFQNRQGEILGKITELVEIESPSRDFSGSLEAVRWIERELAEISAGFKIEKTEIEDLGVHLLIRCFESGEKPILLLGHTDTVHPRGTKRENPTRIEGERLYGCGSFDMKANVVLILEILRAFRELELKPARPVNILLSCDEEIGSPTGRALVEREAARAAFALVCEPSADGRVKTGRKGTGMFKLKAHGVPAHAGLEPEKGASAILELARQIPKIHELNDPEKGTTANVTTIKGGTTSNVIPEFAACEIDVRFKTKAEAERVEKALKDLKPFDRRVALTLTGEINRPPMERTAQTVELYEKAREIAAGFEYPLGETEVGGASDGNFVGALGVPVLDGLGVAGAGAHTLEEFILVEDAPRRAALLALLLLRL
jgi:glutamate carboxypeptidase